MGETSHTNNQRTLAESRSDQSALKRDQLLGSPKGFEKGVIDGVVISKYCHKSGVGGAWRHDELHPISSKTAEGNEKSLGCTSS